MEVTLCYIRKSFFENHSDYQKMLDPGNVNKQSCRTHLCLEVSIDNNHYYIPLRNNLGPAVRKFGRIGHAVPSSKRKNAGLDYRYALVINDSAYIEPQTEMKIPNSQYKRIQNDLTTIQQEFEVYLRGYIKSVQKKRNQKEPLYKESSLINFISEFDV